MMAPVTALLFCHRLPSLDSTQFRNYVEDVHVPLVKSLLGSDHPSTHTRYYTNKDSGYMIGKPASTDADLIAVIQYESEDAMQQSMRVRQSEGVSENIEADEDKFMDRSKLQLIVLGKNDIGMTERGV